MPLPHDPSVITELAVADKTLPVIVRPAAPGLDISLWISNHRDFIDAGLREHGALLLRGFDIDSVELFEKLIVAASSDDWVEYREAATPRSHVHGHIFTSTEYNPKHRIYLHNENSHVTTWPGKLFFYCRTAPASGGETPLADVRRVYARIDPAIRDRFESKGWLYVRTFGYRLGFSWQKVFNTESREEVEDYCRDNYMLAEWLGEDRLRVRYRRWAVLQHPATGEKVWFNHGTFYNVWTLEPALKPLVRSMGEHKMPYNTYYGDGLRVEDEVLEALDAAYRSETVAIPWQRGDMLIVDNMLVAHGRNPFAGDREVFVGMTERLRCEDLAGKEQFQPPM